MTRLGKKINTQKMGHKHSRACSLLLVDYMLFMLFNPEDGSKLFF
jgi:hypothetical protein